MIDVVVVGAGAVGLWLASELRLAGVGVVVFEQALERSPHSRCLNAHARTVEVLNMRGMADAHISEGPAVPTVHFAALSARLDLSVCNSRFPFMLVLPQVRTEERFAERAVGIGAEPRLGHRVTGVHQDDAGAEVAVHGPDGAYGERARFVGGCDGARSAVRVAAAIEFDGHGATRTAAIGDVELSEPPERAAMSVHGPAGSLIVVPMPSGRYRPVVKDVERLNAPRSLQPMFDELRESTRRILGTDLGLGDPTWLARVGNDARIARAYRRGRILRAGDAARIHPPQGGQGLNLGVQDAMSLGWKLAAELNGAAPGWLLDSYECERRPVGASVMQASSAQEELASATTPPELAVRELVAEMLALHPEVNRSLAEKVSGLAVAHPAGEGSHPLARHRAPDLQLDPGCGAGRLFELLRHRRFVLFARSDAPAFGIEHSAVRRATLRPDEATGSTDAEPALVRPDGYFAWLGPGEQVEAACAHWIAGLPRPG